MMNRSATDQWWTPFQECLVLFNGACAVCQTLPDGSVRMNVADTMAQTHLNILNQQIINEIGARQ
jgi:hypothetical protein